MSATRNPGRVVGLWYLLLVFLGPPRLIYIPRKLFVEGDAAATTANIAAHAGLYRFGIVTELLGAVTLIFLVLAFYRLFEGVNRRLAVLLVITGGVMPALLNLVNAATDLTVLTVAQGPAFLSAFDQPHREALVMLLLRLFDHQVTAAEILWGLWLFPMGALAYQSRFVPRFIGVWLFINGAAYVVLSLTGVLFPAYEDRVFLFSQPALFGEIAIVLWLLIKGAELAAWRMARNTTA